jgi:ABC-2 type transport system ATP-binding protein
MSLALEGTAVSKQYGRSWGLRDCSVSLPQGRIAALVGPNGAGKTTLLSLAAGLIRPTAGDLHVLGWDPYRQATLVLPRIGFLAQDVPLYKRWTVEEMLRLGKELNPHWDQERAAKRLRRLGIPFERKIGHLSGGQRAQVALAIALAKRPDLLLLDEPLASLDPLARRDFLVELTEAAMTEGFTVLLSSHVITDLERVCDYLLLINCGRLQAAGEIDQILSQHALLVGPRVPEDIQIAGLDVVRASHSERQSLLWVRARGDRTPLPDAWESKDLSLEDIVVAYLASPEACSLPPPAAVGSTQ